MVDFHLSGIGTLQQQNRKNQPNCCLFGFH
jgi:hypothetical protein